MSLVLIACLFHGSFSIGVGSGAISSFLLAVKYFLRGVSRGGGAISSFLTIFLRVGFVFGFVFGFGVAFGVGISSLFLGVGNSASNLGLSNFDSFFASKVVSISVFFLLLLLVSCRP